jgi:hypothetical protein
MGFLVNVRQGATSIAGVRVDDPQGDEDNRGQPAAQPNKSAVSSPRRRCTAGTLNWVLSGISAVSQGVVAEGRRQSTASARSPARFWLPQDGSGRAVNS